MKVKVKRKLIFDEFEMDTILQALDRCDGDPLFPKASADEKTLQTRCKTLAIDIRQGLKSS